MKKYRIILPIVLLFFIVGCNNEANPSSTSSYKDEKGVPTSSEAIDQKNDTDKTGDKISIDVKTVDSTSTFYFGMTKDDLMIKLKKLKLEVKNEIEITSSEDDPEHGNKQVWTDDISFSFDKNNQLYNIAVKGKISTSLDLKQGDSLEKIENLYGKDYNKYKKEKGFVYDYSFNNNYFRVFVEDDKVSSWTVSKYKFLK